MTTQRKRSNLIRRQRGITQHPHLQFVTGQGTAIRPEDHGEILQAITKPEHNGEVIQAITNKPEDHGVVLQAITNKPEDHGVVLQAMTNKPEDHGVVLQAITNKPEHNRKVLQAGAQLGGPKQHPHLPFRRTVIARLLCRGRDFTAVGKTLFGSRLTRQPRK
jgi:hypothetical protein